MREKELRLALICYGGVSLAVYMHGVTREIWHMVRGSRSFHDGTAPSGGSEAIYHDLIAHIAQTSDIKLRVLADIVAGSSAGGINGIFLAQAMVTGQSLEPLTDMWLDNADVETLLDPDSRPLSRFTKFWATPIAWAILRRRGSAVNRTVAAEARDEVATKLSSFVRARWFKPPFGGKIFSGLLLNAFEAMAKSTPGPKLLPERQPLDLFVTVTDFQGHDQVLRLNSPPQVTEAEHRITIDFSTRGRGDLAPVAELVFAARATASFPGAFPPFSAREMDELLQQRRQQWPTRNAFLQRILPQQFAVGVATDTMLIDGSVLANAPFAQAIGALRNRPARREVDRRFVYIDPKPGRPSFRFGRRASDQEDPSGPQRKERKPPGFFATIFGATSNIPREQPIRDSLDIISGRTERINRIRYVIGSLQGEVEQTIETMLGKTWFLSQPTPERIAKWRGVAQDKAVKAVGFSYPAYGHLKLSGIADDIVLTAKRAVPELPPEHFITLRDTVWSELRRRGLDRMTDEKGLGASAHTIAFFKDHDLRFRIRRLRFIARQLAEEVENANIASDGASATMRDMIYHCLSRYLDLETAEHLGPEFADAVRNGLVAPGKMIDVLAAKRNLVDEDMMTDDAICGALLGLPENARREMLLAYLGYPLYDIATLPLLQDSAFDEFDPVKVDRISPDDAPTIRKGGAAATLKGIEFNNFGAFFSRAYRENDYLWGRLHGTDRLIDILLSTLPKGSEMPREQVLHYKRLAFHAIVDAEADRLKHVAPLIETLRTEIDAIGSEY